MNTIIVAAINGLVLIAVAVIEKRTARVRKEAAQVKEVALRQEGIRRKTAALQLQLLEATIGLDKAMARECSDRMENEEVAAAYRAVEDAQHAYHAFLNEVAMEDAK